MKRYLTGIAAALGAALLAVSLEAAQNRIVAVGDVHGDYDRFVSILQKAELIDAKLRWIGKGSTFVQTGDYFDRGRDVRKVLDLLMKLESAAGRRRGKVIVLLGNHELMNLTGVVVDVNPEAYAAFVNRRSQKTRQKGYRDYLALHERLALRYPEKPPPQLTEAEWLEAHPPGMIEYHTALGPTGRYGRWLRTKNVIVQVGDSTFVHGGISPDSRAGTVKAVNDQVRLEMEAFDRIKSYLVAQKLALPFSTFAEIQNVLQLEAGRPDGGENEDLRRIAAAFKGVYNWSIFHYDGPLWFRGFANWTEEEGEQKMEQLLSRFGTRHFVVGHSIPPDASRILPRFGGKVFLIDTGMLRGYAENGRPSALEIEGSTFSAIYESGRETLVDGSASGPPHRRPDILLTSMQIAPPERAPGSVWLGVDNKVLPFHSSDEVARFLRTAKVAKVHRKRLGGVTKSRKLTVEGGGIRMHAVFRVFHREEENSKWESGIPTEMLRDSWKSEIAAYELSRMLGMNTVPPTVPWTMKKEKGSLQVWIEKAMPGWLPDTLRAEEREEWSKQVDMMRAFDGVIGNMDRHDGNILIGEGWKLWWIDHSRSFMREHEVPDPALIQRTDRRFYEKLKSLDTDRLARAMEPYMGPKEINALLARRLRVIALLEQRIAEHGEDAVLFTLDRPDLFEDSRETVEGGGATRSARPSGNGAVARREASRGRFVTAWGHSRALRAVD
jgi:hypothetical protein